MSQTDLFTMLGSAIVVVLLVVVAWAMGFRKTEQLDAEKLAHELAAAEPRVRIAEAAFAADGRGAIARLSDGKLLTARVMADGVSLRIFPASAATLSLRNGNAVVAFADIGYPPLNLKLKEAAPAWLKALAGEQT